MPLTRSQSALNAHRAEQPVVAENPSQPQRPVGGPALTFEQFEELIEDFYEPEPDRVEVWYRKFETDRNCNGVRCNSLLLRQYPEYIFRHLCPHLEVLPPDSSQELFASNPPAAVCVRLHGALPQALHKVLNFLWECFRYSTLSATRYGKVLPRTGDTAAYHRCYEVMRISGLLRLPQKLLSDPARSIMLEIEGVEASWPGIIERLYSEVASDAVYPNISFCTDQGVKGRFVGAIAYRLIEDEVDDLETVWTLELQYPKFHRDLSEALRKDWDKAEDFFATNNEEDQQDYIDSSADDDMSASSNGDEPRSSNNDSDGSSMGNVSSHYATDPHGWPRGLNSFFEEERIVERQSPYIVSNSETCPIVDVSAATGSGTSEASSPLIHDQSFADIENVSSGEDGPSSSGDDSDPSSRAGVHRNPAASRSHSHRTRELNQFFGEERPDGSGSEHSTSNTSSTSTQYKSESAGGLGDINSMIDAHCRMFPRSFAPRNQLNSAGASGTRPAPWWAKPLVDPKTEKVIELKR